MIGFRCRFGIFMRIFWGILTVWLTILFSQSAWAEKRVALVIGNSAYENVARLANPTNDADAMTATLNAAGFDVVDSRRNLKIADMRKVFRDFADKSRDADVAVVYYAGHGIEVDGTNYLIPVDASLERDLDVYDEAFPLDRILVTIEPAKQLRLVMLDACRDNPFAKTMKRTIGARGIGRGLAKVEPTSPNTLIAFASKAGSTASDGDSKNSPFTSALVKHIATPGLDLRKAFGYVRDDVLKSTSNRQEPYVYGSLGGDDLPLVAGKPVVAAPQPGPQTDQRRDYELALQTGDRDGWEAFLRAYPDGFYADLAKVQLKKIAAEEARVTATEKARLAQEEKTRLAAEGAKQAEQAKAAERARQAEDVRIAAEKAKQVEQAKAIDAEQARATTEKAASAKLAAGTTANQKEFASVSPSPEKFNQDASTPDLPRALQLELRRVGCNTGAVDSDWSAASQAAMALFNKYSGVQLDVKVASTDALNVVRSKTSRVCPTVCAHGFLASGDSCTKISCGAGSFVNDKNECEKMRDKPPRRQEESKPRPVEEQKTSVAQTPSQQPSAGSRGQCNVYAQCLSICQTRGGTSNGCSGYCSRYTRC
jgi:hypothetical protein